jgi:hypothetical protein
MPRRAWRTPIPGCLLLAACSEASAADAADCFSLAAILTATIPTAADFNNPSRFARLHDTAAAHASDAPTPCCMLVTLATFFSETFRILATDQIRTGQEWT